MPRKRPNRTTVNVPLQIAPRFLVALKNDTLRHGFKTQRDYLEALIDQGLPPVPADYFWRAAAAALSRDFASVGAYIANLIKRDAPDVEDDDEETAYAASDPGGRHRQFASAVPALLPAVLGHRTVRALEALGDRIDAGYDAGELVGELRDLRREISAALVGLRVGYDREMDARDERVG